MLIRSMSSGASRLVSSWKLSGVGRESKDEYQLTFHYGWDKLRQLADFDNVDHPSIGS